MVEFKHNYLEPIDDVADYKAYLKLLGLPIPEGRDKKDYEVLLSFIGVR